MPRRTAPAGAPAVGGFVTSAAFALPMPSAPPDAPARGALPGDPGVRDVEDQAPTPPIHDAGGNPAAATATDSSTLAGDLRAAAARFASLPAARHLVQALPYALVLGLVLGLAVMVGANLAHAWPSQSQPNGWPGPASLDAGVASMRPQIAIAASLPALALGLAGGSSVLSSMPARTNLVRSAWPVAAAGLAALVVGVALATWLAAAQSAKGAPGGATAFFQAHLLLALVFWAIGLAASAVAGRFAWPAALAVWLVCTVLYDNTVRWHLLREMGYAGLTARQFPDWFYPAFAASPLAAYRAFLILAHPQFRDYEERAALDGAALPEWLAPATMGWVLLAWMVVPLALAAAALQVRAVLVRRRQRAGLAVAGAGVGATGPAGGAMAASWLPGSAAPAASNEQGQPGTGVGDAAHASHAAAARGAQEEGSAGRSAPATALVAVADD